MHDFKNVAIFAAFVGMAAQPVCAVEWVLCVEKGGAINVVTAANCPFAIDVSFSEASGAGRSPIVKRARL